MINNKKYANLLMFWNFLTKGLKRTDYIEIRAMNIINNEVYNLIREFSIAHDVKCNKNCQLFFKLEDFQKFLVFMDKNFINKNCKLCYGLAPRQVKEGKISGSYNNTGFATMIFFDIEKTTHSDTTRKEKESMLVYVYFVADFLRRYGLKYYYVIDSGAGFHLLYRIPRTRLSEGKKRWFKHFIETLHDKLKTDSFHFDKLKDFTRVFGLPESDNIKRKQKVSVVREDDRINNEFKFRTKKEIKFVMSGVKHSISSVLIKEPLIDFMMNSNEKALKIGSKLSRNSYLELQLGIMFRDNNINLNDVQDIIHNINLNMNKKIQIDPKYIPANAVFSKNTVNKWSMTCCNGYKIYRNI